MSGETLEMEAAQTISNLLEVVMNGEEISIDELRSCTDLLDRLEENSAEFAEGDRVRYSEGNGGVATVVTTVPIQANEFVIKGMDQTVSEYHDLKYATDPVVICKFSSDGEHYYFPESTLEAEESSEKVNEVVNSIELN